MNSFITISDEWTPKEIIGVQIRANDFDGALETFKSYRYESGWYLILKELPNMLGVGAQLNAAFDVLSQHSDYRTSPQNP